MCINSDLKRIKNELQISRVLSYYNIPNLTQNASQLRGTCPIHGGDNKTSFSVNLESNLWYCFSRGHGGSSIDFIMGMEKCEINKAISICLYILNNSSVYTQKNPAKIITTTKISEGENNFNKPLTFKLPLDPYHSYFLARGIRTETASLFGAGYLSKGKYRWTICFPIHDINNNLVAYSARSINGSEPRYRIIPYGLKKSNLLYNLHRIKNFKCSELIVVEGFFDLLTLYQVGYKNVVALMGSHMSNYQAEMLIKQDKRIILMLDGDEAGIKGTENALKLLQNKIEIDAVYLPFGLQPDSMTKDEVKKHLTKTFKTALIEEVVV